MQCTGTCIEVVIYDSCDLRSFAVMFRTKIANPFDSIKCTNGLTCHLFPPLLEEVSKPQAAEKAGEPEKTEAAEAKAETAQSS